MMRNECVQIWISLVRRDKNLLDFFSFVICLKMNKERERGHFTKEDFLSGQVEKVSIKMRSGSGSIHNLSQGIHVYCAG